ncbi:uncharacterized protein KGF55_000966 [Candida pseudojiufengensis]|uniref:uncharacterized protein n=1 Tax=Candida pseudojiufengensis TaxID=497109 RepID=UPI0022247E0D|nr:uncharacterized protein KGF55_000966 [Candida pseudojiufengensis]KAI5965604.1 hypothetical protein KGF55_000966 [Candida pseudojiufengensis]
MLQESNIPFKHKDLDFQCETCSMTKNFKKFPKSFDNPDSPHPLELLHVDLCDMTYGGFEDERYLLVIVDDYSSMKFTFPLVHKSDCIDFHI